MCMSSTAVEHRTSNKYFLVSEPSEYARKDPSSTVRPFRSFGVFFASFEF